jgi:glycosyltransferase involved in cell wall biosynthesis
MDPALAVVIPVYNEAGTIREVLATWSEELERLGIDYEIRVYDDGSTDRTPEILRDVAARCARIVVVSHANRGHGPTVLRGYREASAEWVFQTDGDGEGSPRDFASLWHGCDALDFVVGRRATRRAPLVRRWVTLGCRLAIRGLFGTPIHDANSPYRLMRRSALLRMLPDLPDDTFAPNAVLSGLAARDRLRIAERPIAWEGRRAGAVSLFGWRLWKAAFRSLWQTVAIAHHRRAGPAERHVSSSAAAPAIGTPR